MLVHCKAGISRSATVCIAYIMWFKHWTMETAYQFLKSKRSLIAPNLNFMRQLLEFQNELEASGRACAIATDSDESNDVAMTSLSPTDVTTPERKLSRSSRSSASSYTSAISCTCDCDDVGAFHASASLTSSSLSSCSSAAATGLSARDARRSMRSVTSLCSFCSNSTFASLDSDVIHDSLLSPVTTPLSAYHTPLQSAGFDCACRLRHSGAAHACDFSAFVFHSSPLDSAESDDVTRLRPSRDLTASPPTQQQLTVSGMTSATLRPHRPPVTSDTSVRPKTALPALFQLPVTTSSCAQQVFSFDFASVAGSMDSSAAAGSSPVVCNSPLLSPS